MFIERIAVGQRIYSPSRLETICFVLSSPRPKQIFSGFMSRIKKKTEKKISISVYVGEHMFAVEDENVDLKFFSFKTRILKSRQKTFTNQFEPRGTFDNFITVDEVVRYSRETEFFGCHANHSNSTSAKGCAALERQFNALASNIFHADSQKIRCVA